jgi:DNA-binding transcriptional MerR regulator
MTKGPEAFRTISEASDEIGVAQHVLRFWETRFPFIRPMRRAGGRRFYRPRDIVAMKTLRRLLHDEGMSISEVQTLYRARRKARADVVDSAPTQEVVLPDRERGLASVLLGLETAKSRLETVLAGR